MHPLLSNGALPCTVIHFRTAADGQREIQACSLVHFDHDAILVDGFKAACLDGNIVLARQEGWDAVLALLVRQDGARCTRVCILHTDSCIGHRQAGRVADQSGEFGILGEHRCQSKGKMYKWQEQKGALMDQRT